MIKIIELKQTCSACPSQWDGLTDDNRKVYIRYRWGSLSVSIGEINDMGEYAGVRGKTVLYKKLRDGLNGVLNTEELKETTKDKILWAD